MMINIDERKKAKREREREKNVKTDREVKRKKMKEIYDTSFWKKTRPSRYKSRAVLKTKRPKDQKIKLKFT